MASLVGVLIMRVDFLLSAPGGGRGGHWEAHGTQTSSASVSSVRGPQRVGKSAGPLAGPTYG
eukprot:9293193-Pyramimonas_sp.AAC.1